MVLLTAGAFPARAQSTERKLAANKTMISLVDARNRIDKAIAAPVVMTAIMKHLSAADQKQFLADVNKAISDMPASAEEKAAKFLNVDHAALKGAAKGNVSTLIAEVFATVPVDALTVINERFAIDLLNRSTAGVTYTDAQFTQIARDVMAKVNERCAEADNGDPRSAFAILMLLRASGGSPADLSEKLVDTLKTEEAKEMARNEWIPAALGKEDRSQISYESLLASADAGRRPDYDFVLIIAGPQYCDSVLQDILGKNSDPLTFISTRTPVLDAVENPLRHSIPIIGADLADRADVAHQEGGDIEPGPYPWQTIR